MVSIGSFDHRVYLDQLTISSSVILMATAITCMYILDNTSNYSTKYMAFAVSICPQVVSISPSEFQLHACFLFPTTWSRKNPACMRLMTSLKRE